MPSTATRPSEAELLVAIERSRELSSQLNTLYNLGSSLQAAKKALDVAAEQATESIGRAGIDLVRARLQDVINIAEMSSANQSRLWEERRQLEGVIAEAADRTHKPIVESLPVWSLYGTPSGRHGYRPVTCLLCGRDVIGSESWDEEHNRMALRHYTRSK